MTFTPIELAGSDIVDRCRPLVREPLSADAAAALAPMLKALSDPVRLRLLSLMASNECGEACVCDMAGHFNLSQPTISHHLKKLREAGIVAHERRGSWIFYRVVPGALHRLTSVLDDYPQVISQAS